MKSKLEHTSLPLVNTPLRDLEGPLQAEIDRIVNGKVGLYLSVQMIVSMLVIVFAQWLLNPPASTLLTIGLLYVAGIFAFSLFMLRRLIQKVERFKQAAGSA